jgi:hypothetical protein
MPTVGRPKLIYDQATKLYSEINSGISMAQKRRSKLRMFLNVFEFQTFFQHALDHFCHDIDTPFDFVQASFSNKLTSLFSQNVLAVAVSMIKLPIKLEPDDIFERISSFAASCILIHAVRHNIRGWITPVTYRLVRLIFFR